MAGLKIGLNGAGRINRLLTRIVAEKNAALKAEGKDPEVDIAFINELCCATADGVRQLRLLTKYDSAQGRYEGEVGTSGSKLVIGGMVIPVIAEADPAKLPSGEMGVFTVVEGTGAFVKAKTDEKPGYDSHLDAGAETVVLTAPAKAGDLDGTIVLGVNDDQVVKGGKIYSNASCTTNCLAHLVKAIHDAFTILTGLMTTIHAATKGQDAVDGFAKGSLRRAWSALVNDIVTSTGAAIAIGKVIPELDGKLNGIAIRDPKPTGSIVDLCVNVEKAASADEVNKILKAAAETKPNIMGYCIDELASSAFTHDSRSCIVDSLSTLVIGNMVKVFGWYDNEWGYANRLYDLLVLIGQVNGILAAA